MDENISMIRFLMFMILALIIFFNIAPQLVDRDDDNNASSSDNVKNAIESDKSESDDSGEYDYSTDDVDKLTIMTSEDMIYCLKNDKECKEMQFGDCHDVHIGTYLTEDNCEEAKNDIAAAAAADAAAA
jgi:hypothetical protein|tara:strand:- start:229 stop:615 length:387 start_codon:yes stop_codon:yes gene_type:complete